MDRALFPSLHQKPAWVPPTGKVLAFLHGGRIFTETLPYLGRAVLVLWGAGFLSWWLGSWVVLFRDYERWRLVGATLVHIAFLALAYLFGRIAWLRFDHLRHIPRGDSAALRSLPILLRLTSELFFVGSIALAIRILLMPSESWPSVLGKGGALGLLQTGAANAISGLAFGAGTTLSVALWALLVLVAFYVLANAIEIYLAIEINTRHHDTRSSRNDDAARPSSF